ncbi:MAG: undecaprenyl-diphosphate phosphatase [Candidatus Latescibacterota bacterium]|nr:MAG: undecaprenyl-diphosphate phosphatase [Candidatus Latescibacterota bacterium]
MGPLAAAILGLVQGLTEFLPVSSSGHLVLAQTFLGVKTEGILLEILLHLGTTLVVVVFYRREIVDLLRPRFDPAVNRYRLAILLGLIPAGLVGVFFLEPLEALYENPSTTLGELAFTGLFLLATRYAKPGNRTVTPWTGFLIGIAQAVAILPGVSRSGATIATALFLGIERKHAAEFSFVMSIPAILGAALLTAREIRGAEGEAAFLVPALLGTLVAIVSGYFALRFLVRVVQAGRLHLFGWYCLALALVGAIALVLVGG